MVGQRIAADLQRAAERATEDITFDDVTNHEVPMGFTKYFAMMHAASDGDLTGRTLLDVGCGSGGCMAQAFGLGMLPTGIDIYAGQGTSRDAARRLLSAYGMATTDIDRNVRYGDITRSVDDLAARFDFAISIGMLEHIADPAMRRTAVMNMMRTLKPGGMMILECAPNRWAPVDLFHYGPRYPFYHWLPDRLKTEYMARLIRPRRPDLNDIQAAPEFLSGLRVSEITRAVAAAQPAAVTVRAFPIVTRVAVTRAWLRRRSAQAFIGFASRTLTQLKLEPVIVIVAQCPVD
jgi:2-polyprenyl-3-methyl-5-hydroxy-6-metoxy-1,4-benzoquinol methylase